MASRRRDLPDMLVRAGWTFRRVTGSGHQQWECPCGRHLCAFPMTPGDTKGTLNSKSTIRRICPETIAA